MKKDQIGEIFRVFLYSIGVSLVAIISLAFIINVYEAAKVQGTPSSEIYYGKGATEGNKGYFICTTGRRAHTLPCSFSSLIADFIKNTVALSVLGILFIYIFPYYLVPNLLLLFLTTFYLYKKQIMHSQNLKQKILILYFAFVFVYYIVYLLSS